MQEKVIQDIHGSLHGVMAEGFSVPGVVNLFEPGSVCDKMYADMLAAYERLCERLGVVDEDVDVEIIIHSLMQIEREISYKMFEYGRKFALDDQ